LVAIISLSVLCGIAAAEDGAPAGMVLIPGGTFAMGSDQADTNANERPVHQVRVSPFWMDRTEVTNADFARFVAATGHVTTAERAVDWDDLRKQLPPDAQRPSDADLAPGSLVFTPPTEPVGDARTCDIRAWW